MNKANRSAAYSRKQAVSIRMSRSDVRHIKALSERLGVRDSDVFRFAIKSMLAKLAPLQDPAVTGRALVPVFIQSGTELMRHFDLDAGRLAAIINEGAEETRRVDLEDIQLIAMNGVQGSYDNFQLTGLRRVPGSADTNGHREESAAGNGHGKTEQGAGDQPLRQYLYEKYLFSRAQDPAGHRAGGA